MALAEFAAIEAAYRALAPLNPAARHRALAWLTSALGGSETLREETGSGPAPAVEVAKPPAKSAPAKRARRATPAGTRATPAGTRATAAGSGERHSVTAKRQAATRGGKSSSSKKAVKATTSTTAAAERAYRRMPDVAEVLGAYRQVGTVSGLAEHFGVPRHTVQGWARRLRREGHIIGRS
jgi:type IV secretory pathway TrbL component